MTLLTFIIPVRHQQNARDWSHLKANLTQTIGSIDNQTHPDWRGIIVANEGADLPPLPDNFSVTWVTFPPNDIHERGNATEADFLDAFRFDKGRRVLSGMLSARNSRFFMVVDDDDFVSARLTQYVSEHKDSNGWFMPYGYVWGDGGKLLFAHRNFNDICGTSLIVRADAYGIPPSFDEVSVEWIKDMLGSHKRILTILSDRRRPLEPLPFEGAIYRVAHRGSHSNMPGIFFMYFRARLLLRQPFIVLGNISRLRLLYGRLRREFKVPI